MSSALPDDDLSGLAEAVAAAFSSAGPLARADAGFSARLPQLEMAEGVSQAIEGRKALVVEAGTGVGKTFAYLVPVLLSGRRALVSTATKNLQDQLFFRDLPRLRDALALPASIALLKGRASYLCRHRLGQAREGALLSDRMAVRALARIEQWGQATTSGDMGELEGLDERSEIIPLVTSTRENCLGSECPEYHNCHVMKARREAMAADIVVVNHHLFFADLSLKDSGVAELLPTVDIAVFDEAHQMVEAGVQFLGQNLGTGQVLDFSRDLLAAGLQHARGMAPWADLAGTCDLAARQLRLSAAEGAGDVRAIIKRRWEEVVADGALQAPLEELAAALKQAATVLQDHLGAAPDFSRLQGRAMELAAQAARFQMRAADDRVRWVDLTPHQARLIESPLDIRAMMTEQRAAGSRAWVFTSATLGDDEGLSWFCEAAGLEDADKLRLGSPFDYPANARVYVPPRFPAPNESAHLVMVGRAAAHCAAALGGRTFVLTTTLRALGIAAEAMKTELASLGADLELLVQGQAPKRTLLARFAQGRSVLLGSHSFWEGIDVPGDALQCVIIDKLPFPPPNDPLVEARVRHLKAQGRDAFADYFVAEAAIALKQGAGRLIRTESDKGLLVICDTRLLHARYGARLLQALPPMAPLKSGEQALAWLRELA
ncbi:ATP-dependent DNA helicase [Ideonella sp.]|jgi:ATP-dependent DNA helicase DinG|uniref:ATP-dependent DNA helicase n=1 Tax=Ideonella sp. TaxID=1929293 RepID=UPI0037C04AA8